MKRLCSEPPQQVAKNSGVIRSGNGGFRIVGCLDTSAGSIGIPAGAVQIDVLGLVPLRGCHRNVHTHLGCAVK